MKSENESFIEEVVFKCFGTSINIRLVIGDDGLAATANNDLEKVRQIYYDAQKRFSRFDEDSELSFFNRNLNHSKEASSEMIIVAKKILEYNSKTNGVFDARIIEALEKSGYDKDFDDISKSSVSADHPLEISDNDLSEELLLDENDKMRFLSRMDFSGIVKGYVTDKVASFLIERGWRNFFVDSGGDIFFAGMDEENNRWRVDIEGIPYEKMMLVLSDEAVATSGIGKRKWERDGRRFHHLVDPRVPENFSFDIKSVTVVSETTEQADVLAKTIFILGKIGGMDYAKQNDIACVMLDSRGGAWISPSMRSHLFRQADQE